MDDFFFKEIEIAVNGIKLKADLSVPVGAKGLVVFAHGSGSSRKSTRNVAVAEFLQNQSFATLLFDLLTLEEGLDAHNRFNIGLISERLIGVTRWLFEQEETKHFSIGYFGASTGAAAALNAAAQLPEIKAVVSRGGRPDLALDLLSQVNAPVLLIVGSLDVQVIELNIIAYNEIAENKKLEIVEGATHLFEEPGTLEKVMQLAADWFEKHLV